MPRSSLTRVVLLFSLGWSLPTARKLRPCCCLTLLLLIPRSTNAQVVINELVQDERSASGGQIVDTREFIELHNVGNTSVDLSTWSIRVVDLDSGGVIFTIPLTSNPVLAAGDYYVIGNSAGINPALIDFNTELNDLLENDNNLYELRNGNGELVDALGVQLTFAPQYDFVTAEQLAQIGGGWWGQVISSNTSTPQSLGRYMDGRDTDNNGRDFGLMPLTPGTSNNLPVASDVVPDVDALGLSLGSDVPGISSSFVQPKVVDPTVTGTYVKHAITASPQGGNAIVAWDPSGGGNMVASNALVNNFAIWAYLDTEPLNVSTGGFQWDATTYGIGTSDPFFAPLDPTDIFTTAGQTSNGNTGIGWVYLREETTNFESLMLIDFNDGGDSLPTGADWTVLETIDLTSIASDWHQLSIDYDPLTGEVVARYDEQVFTHNIGTEVIGTFYVGYRESLSGGVPSSAGPPIFDVMIGLPADYNQNGIVDAADYTTWRDLLGQSVTLPNENPAAATPGLVDAEDYAFWKNNFGATLGSGSSSAFPLSPSPLHNAVPEPATFALLCLGIAGVLVARVRRNL